jgi:hypothetical protein
MPFVEDAASQKFVSEDPLGQHVRRIPTSQCMLTGDHPESPAWDDEYRTLRILHLRQWRGSNRGARCRVGNRDYEMSAATIAAVSRRAVALMVPICSPSAALGSH